MEHEYDIALSFAGENRDYVQQVAQQLRENGINVFYDDFEKVDLWGKDLSVHFARVYGGGIARYCIPFISKHYAAKAWTTYEIRNALSRTIESPEEYILPARFDYTEIEGLRKSISYIDLAAVTPQEFAHLVIKKLGKNTIIKKDTSNTLVSRPKPLVELLHVALNLYNITLNDGRRNWLPVCLNVQIINSSQDTTLVEEPFFRLDAPLDKSNDSFSIADKLQFVEFPYRLETDQYVEVTYLFRPGSIDALYRLAIESNFYAVVLSETGKELTSNKIMISGVKNVIDLWNK